MTIALMKLIEDRYESDTAFEKAFGLTPKTVNNWKRGVSKSYYKMLPKLAEHFEVSTDYILARSDSADTPNTQQSYSKPDYDLVKLPVLSMGNVVCAGNGFSLDYVDEEIAGYEYFSRSDLGPIDETNGPFVMRVEGDSMEEAGIPDGAKVAINPAAEVYDGDPALVCYGLNRERAVKWIYWGTDGSVKIRSSNSRYEPRIFTREDRDLGFFFVVGKVMQVSTKPLRG